MTEDYSVSYKALTVHEFHSFIMRQYEAGIIDENKKDFRLSQYHTFVNPEGKIYVHVSELNKLEQHENN
tara:strand:- start:321 stop:527 length:207 start_codon:yes stop_codon:yes gene_type:complete